MKTHILVLSKLNVDGSECTLKLIKMLINLKIAEKPRKWIVYMYAMNRTK